MVAALCVCSGIKCGTCKLESSTVYRVVQSSGCHSNRDTIHYRYQICNKSEIRYEIPLLILGCVSGMDWRQTVISKSQKKIYILTNRSIRQKWQYKSVIADGIGNSQVGNNRVKSPKCPTHPIVHQLTCHKNSQQL